MEEFFENLKEELGKCTKWQKVYAVFKSGISPENIQILIEILRDFSINDPEINCVIETNRDNFLEQMKIVCYHIISEFYNFTTIDTQKTEFFTINVKWFYVIFVYFALKRMVCKEIIHWPNFRENENIEKMFIDSLMVYERNLPRDYYDKGLKPSFRILISFITVSQLLQLEGIGDVPECIYDY